LPFNPIYPAHSIERCALSIQFNQTLPQKAIGRVVDELRPALRSAGLEAENISGFSFQVDSQGRMLPVNIPGPSQFRTADRGTSLLFSPNLIVMQTARYVRWAPFVGQIEELILPAALSYCQSVNLIGIQLEYLDTFLWEGSWDDFRWDELLRRDSGFVAARASVASKQWHSNSGWFEFVGGNIRRLQKVDIEIVERATTGGGAQPAINILSTMKEEAYARVPASSAMP
jgi:uncharacterized protein (TIGR04255 family)